ncbi:MAG: C-GCAxxG-C-C family protein [Bacillota bacterium]|nr:C-GCAxxG-C-C family protein [Bacillota bacterium]
MSEKGKRAKQLFMDGYNCSQAVLGAFAEEIGLDFNTAVLLASPFGGGIGRMRETCGAVSGMMMAAGMLYGYTDPNASTEKIKTYETARNLADKFKENNGSIICRELLGLSASEPSHEPEKRTDTYYKKRPCPEIVEIAADILDDYISQNK